MNTALVIMSNTKTKSDAADKMARQRSGFQVFCLKWSTPANVGSPSQIRMESEKSEIPVLLG